MKEQPIKTALLSTTNKSLLPEFAIKLTQKNIQLISSGGTHKILANHGIKAVEVSDFTGFPEIMGGRVKTLHPKIHGGILSRRQQDKDVMEKHDLITIDLVVVNLYAFVDTISKTNVELADAIENIDIGGPTLIRAAAKNFSHVCVIVDPDDYAMVLSDLDEHNGTVAIETRFKLAAKAFAYTANYESHIANFLNKLDFQPNKAKKPIKTRAEFPDIFTLQWQKVQDMRYGENPHQQAAFYKEIPSSPGSLANAEQTQGKPLSFNNIADADAAFNCVTSFSTPTCVIVKHANPCGVATDASLISAYEKAFQTDPTSAFGGIIAFNQPLDKATASKIIANQFVEVIITPSLLQGAAETLQQKPNTRVLLTGNLLPENLGLDYKKVNGGLLVQTADNAHIKPSDLTVVSQRQPSSQEMQDLLFAWHVVKHVKSNAIIYAKNNRTIGIGAGQMSRVDSATIAAQKAQQANFSLNNAAMASDAFFPFRDSIDTAAKVGITAVIQPGGSMRDQEVIDAVNQADMTMVLTGVRHFRH